MRPTNIKSESLGIADISENSLQHQGLTVVICRFGHPINRGFAEQYTCRRGLHVDSFSVKDKNSHI